MLFVVICLVLILVVCAYSVYISANNRKEGDEEFKESIYNLCWGVIVVSIILYGMFAIKETSKRTTDEEHCCQTECYDTDSTMVNKFE